MNTITTHFDYDKNINKLMEGIADDVKKLNLPGEDFYDLFITPTGENKDFVKCVCDMKRRRTNMDIKEIIDKIKSKKEISISTLQRECSMGYVAASALFKQLIQDEYVVLNTVTNKYVLNKKKCGVKEEANLKLIFLDVDGVLNCSTTKDDCCGFKGIEDEKVNLLKQIVDATDAKIVLVSSWKNYWYKEPYLKEKQDEFANYLDAKLAKQGLTIIDKTNDFESFNRGDGINIFLENLKLLGLNVGSFIIFDDEMFDYKYTKLTKHLIQTGYTGGGLLPKHVTRAIEKLNQEV